MQNLQATQAKATIVSNAITHAITQVEKTTSYSYNLLAVINSCLDVQCANYQNVAVLNALHDTVCKSTHAYNLTDGNACYVFIKQFMHYAQVNNVAHNDIDNFVTLCTSMLKSTTFTQMYDCPCCKTDSCW